jgi:hypothetical protein
VTNPADRYHLILISAGRPVAHGWWGRELTARAQFTTWVGAWGNPGARVTLIDQETGDVLEDWSAAD